jgi:hypothetical protein
VTRDAEVGDDGAGGHRVVAGDHPDPDAGVAALGDRVAGLRPGRVDDAYERDEHDAVEQILRIRGGRDGVGREVLRPDREYPHALLGELAVPAGVACRCRELGHVMRPAHIRVGGHRGGRAAAVERSLRGPGECGRWAVADRAIGAGGGCCSA